MKVLRKLVPKKLEDVMANLGPIRCAVTGLFLYASEKALATITANEFRQGDYIEAITYGAATLIALYGATTFLVVGDGWIPLRNYYNKKKKEARARRIYNAWKNYPSYKTIENKIKIT